MRIGVLFPVSIFTEAAIQRFASSLPLTTAGKLYTITGNGL